MSEIWEHNRPFAVAILVWVGGALLFFFAVHLPFSGPVSELRGDSHGRAALAEHYASTERSSLNPVPFADAKRALEGEQAELAAALAGARRRIEFVPTSRFTIGSAVAERPLEYSKIRKAAASELGDLANKASVVIPGELDPRNNSKSLPKEGETDELLFRLAMTDRVVRTAVAAQVPRVASILHKLGAPRGSPLAQRFVRVRLEGELDHIIRFVGKCSTPPGEKEAAPAPATADPAPGSPGPRDPGGGALAVRSVEIASSGNGSTLTADIELAAITVLKVKPKRRARATRSAPQPGRRARPSW